MKKKHTTIIILTAVVLLLSLGGFYMYDMLYIPAETLGRFEEQGLSAKAERQIKQGVAKRKNLEGFPTGKAKADEVRIAYYCGTYNDSIVILVEYNFFVAAVTHPEIIANVKFWYSGSYRLFVWRKGSLYDLEKADKKNLLTHEDALNIKEILEQSEYYFVNEMKAALYCGTYNSSDVFLFEYEFSVAAEKHTEIIAGMQFEYVGPYRLFLLRLVGEDEGLYYLSKADEKNLLIYDDILNIKEILEQSEYSFAIKIKEENI